MSLFNPNDAIISKEIQSVQFGFYQDQDVRERSVVEITLPDSFDPNQNAVPNGLYDPHLGPTPGAGGRRMSTLACPTCALSVQNCPGHYGHIELVVPIYQPLLFLQIVTAMRLKCLSCHRLKAPIRFLRIVQAKLYLLQQARVQECLELDNRIAAAMHSARDMAYDDNDLQPSMVVSSSAHTAAALERARTNRLATSALEEILQPILPTPEQITAAALSGHRRHQDHHSQHKAAKTMTSYERAVWKQLVQEAIASCKTAASRSGCPHCGAYSPRVRSDGHNKIFQVALSKTHQRLNQATGTRFRSALIGLNNNNAESTSNSTYTDGNNRPVDDDGYQSDDTWKMDPRTNINARHQRDEDDQSEVGSNTDDKDGDDDEDNQAASARDKYMHPGEIQAQLQRLWKLEPYLCNCMFGTTQTAPQECNVADYFNVDGYKIFFMQVISVPPSRFRPPMFLNGASVEHAQTQYLGNVIKLQNQVRDLLSVASAVSSSSSANDDDKEQNVPSKEAAAYTAWIELQTTVNSFMDSSMNPAGGIKAANIPTGIRQLLERKEGLFRKHMMGKRVNYACRSVISPDPYVGTNEIGLPQHFAKVLTYAVPVTPWNVHEVRQWVIRGSDDGGRSGKIGARWIEKNMTQGNGRVRLDLSKMNLRQREAAAAQLLVDPNSHAMPVIVGRQMRDGDYVLMNRQPTLHKPGIMAHRVRILHNPSQKTIRMHYANCNTYNADFDGDEMNCHFPQNELGRAEAHYIAKTDLQYIVPTDGTPLRGLIQDHVVAGVKLTMKDTFLQKWEYQQLLFAALATLPGLELIAPNMDIELLPPAIMKPRERWTGKQVITTLLMHLRKDNKGVRSSSDMLPGISAALKSKTPESVFGPNQDEHLVIVRDGELLRGVLDKSAFGPTGFSLVHAVYEAYGPEKAGLLLDAFGRLFTAYIQFYSGHSCRVEDLILTKEADIERRKLVERSYNVGSRAAKAWADSEGGKIPISAVTDMANADRPLKPVEVVAAAAKIGELLSGTEGKENFAALDGFMQAHLNPLSSDIVQKCLPSGLQVPFPYNTFGVMTTTGAKGSIVNQSQVSCALGQQALEGRRVPRMSSGKTLPSFAPYDPNPRADGFVLDRFLTGIRPQEYYFHCMAGREGLVDTAVKTSRSGYLQRCLIKHLEELKVCYDFTVRNAEGGIVQFLYGEDGLDPTKASYLDCSTASFEFMARNSNSLKRRNMALPSSSIDAAASDAERVEVLRGDEEQGRTSHFAVGDQVLARRPRAGSNFKRGGLLHGWHEAIVTKCHEHGHLLDLQYILDGHKIKKAPVLANLGHCGGNQEAALSNLAVLVIPAAADPMLSSTRGGHRIGVSGSCVSERVAKAASHAIDRDNRLKRVLSQASLSRDQFSSLVAAKYSSSLCAPGEAVGSIAAQSVGEPSTQMTLNTFHLAGSGANVTLGIPRLREIIMSASKEPKTPTMSVPLRDFVTDKQAVRLKRDFMKLTLLELISGHRGVSVSERLEVGDSGEWVRAYYVTLKLHPAERIKDAFGLTLHDVAVVVGVNFVPLLTQLMKKDMKRSAVEGDIGGVDGGGSSRPDEDAGEDHESSDDRSESRRVAVNDDGEDDDDDDNDDEAPGVEDGVEGSKYQRHKESEYYQNDDSADEDNEEEKTADNENPLTALGDEEQSPFFAASKVSPTVVSRSNVIVLQPLRVDPSTRPILMVSLVEAAAGAILVQSRKKISEAFINEETGRGKCFQTSGVCFPELWELESVEHNKLVSNDIWAMRCSYGVEAARCTIVEQIRHVFGAYGIEVDPRHLSLIADYMTFDGGYIPMNRTGMNHSSSSFLQMSFETTVTFLKQAAAINDVDRLESPSANLVMGKPIRHGTGSFQLLAT